MSSLARFGWGLVGKVGVGILQTNRLRGYKEIKVRVETAVGLFRAEKVEGRKKLSAGTGCRWVMVMVGVVGRMGGSGKVTGKR